MQALTRWRNFFTLKNSFIAAAAAASSSQSASFRSTPILLQKNKRNNDVRREEKPSKDHIRFETRQKRADTKKALKNLLFNGGSPRSTIFEDHTRNVASDYDNATNSSNRRNKAKSFSAHRANKEAHQKRMKRKKRRGSFSDEDDEFPENSFRATFGHKCYTWSFVGNGGFFTENSNNYFEWKEPPKNHTRQKDWMNESDHESSDDETTPVENSSQQERILLGLPPLGDITIGDVKKAFRLSALKWHPDKHQGPSQVMAEEKFRQCLDAYKYLCGIHSSRLA